jgi:hypothetical protein
MYCDAYTRCWATTQYACSSEHNNSSCVLCGPRNILLLGNTTILDKRRLCFLWYPTRGYITGVSNKG